MINENLESIKKKNNDVDYDGVGCYNSETIDNSLTLEEAKERLKKNKEVLDDIDAKLQTTKNMVDIFIDEPSMEHLIDMHMNSTSNLKYLKALILSNIKILEEYIQRKEKEISNVVIDQE